MWERERSWFRAYLSGHFNQLLIFLFLVFLFRPYGRGPLYTAIWELCFTGVFFASVFNCRHPKRVKIAATVLGIPALLLNWITLAFPWPVWVVVSQSLTLAFMALCTASILYGVVLRARVTMETLRGVVCAYFMIGFVFSFSYLLIEYLFPGSFHLIDRDVTALSHSHYLSEMMYFSFVTLLAIGYGDITPLTDFGQTIVILEATMGQFYIAILVSRIVSVYSFISDKNLLNKIKEMTHHE
jgi:hypothetical protein